MLLLNASIIDAKAFSLVEPLKPTKTSRNISHILHQKQKTQVELMIKDGNFKIGVITSSIQVYQTFSHKGHPRIDQGQSPYQIEPPLNQTTSYPTE